MLKDLFSFKSFLVLLYRRIHSTGTDKF